MVFLKSSAESIINQTTVFKVFLIETLYNAFFIIQKIEFHEY